MNASDLGSTSPQVVLVNDGLIQRNIQQALLEAEDLDVRAFESAEAALAAMALSKAPDLIITDLHMAGIDGWRFCRLLRSSEFAAYNTVPILVLSATFAGEETTRMTVDLGANAFLAWPTERRTLIAQVWALIKGERRPIRPHALLVEDSQSLLGALRRAFETAGYEVSTTDTVQGALSILERQTCSVAILDYYLPDGLGDQLLDELRKRQPDCIAIMMTTDPGPQLALDWMLRGAAAYVRKPFNPAYLLEVVSRALREKGLLRVQDRLEERTRQLQESETRLRATLDYTPNVAVQWYDTQGRVTFWNRASEIIYGFSAEEILGKTLGETILSPEEAEHFEQVFQDIRQTGQAFGPTEVETQTRSGERVWVLSTTFLMPGTEGHPLFVCMDVDITARKRAEEERRKTQEALHMSKERLSYALEASNDGLWDWNLQTQQVYFSPRYYLMLEYQPGDFEPCYESWRNLVHPDDLPGCEKHLKTCIQLGTNFEMEMRLKTASGAWKWILGRGKVMERDEKGHPLRMLGTHVDITERRINENNLRLFKDLVHHASDAIGMSTPEGRHYYQNEAFNRLFGDVGEYPPDTLYVDHELGAEVFRTIMAGDVWQGEVKMLGKDGSLLDIHLRAFSILDDSNRVMALVGLHTDITEAKRTQQALIESENRHRMILDHSSDLLWSITPDGRFLYLSPSWKRITGYEPSELINTFAASLVHPEDQLRCRSYLEQVLMGDLEARSIEYRAKHADGTWHWHEGSSRAVLNSEGQAISMVGVARIIDELKAAQKALSDSEALYRAIFESTGTPSIIIEEDTTIALANSEWLNLTGYSREEMEGRMSWTIFVHPEDLARMKTYHVQRRMHSEGVPRKYEFRFLRRNGEIRDILNVVSLLPDGKRSIASLMDLTDRKMAEAAVVEREARLRALIDAAPFGAFLYELKDNGDLVFRGYNLSANHILQVDCAQFIGLTLEEAFPPLAETHIPVRYREVAREGRVFQTEEVNYSHGKITGVFDVHAFQIQPGWTAIFFADITERRKAEMERLELERRLLHAQKLESLGILAGGIAHDFNNLLMAMLGNLELALLELSPLSSAKPHLERIEKSVLRASDLTRQMLAYSGRGAFLVQAMNLNDLVEENVHLFRAAVSKNVTFRVDLDPQLPKIQADPGQIQQVIMNLVTNASEAMGESAGVLALSTHHRRVNDQELSGSRCPEIPPEGAFVELIVRDTGVGMDQATLDRIFDPFFTTKFTGRGLGLSALLGIVKGHKGAIFIDSVPGEGTTVRALFPILPGEDSHPTEPVPVIQVRPMGPGPGIVLLVDDESILLETGEMLLKYLGFTALTADNGISALELLRNPPEDLKAVILDLTMPGLDGLGTLKEIRKTYPHLPVLLSSGYNEEEIMGRVDDQSFLGFLHKPYTLKSLDEALKLVLKRTEGC